MTVGADAGRPLDGGVRANLRPPFRADLRQVIGPDEGGAGIVPAADDHDGLRGKLHTGIELRNRGIVPGLDLAEKDLRQCRSVEPHLAGLDALEVHNRNRAADHAGELNEAILVELIELERHVGGAESDDVVANVSDPGARADLVVVHHDSGLFLIGIRPFRKDRIGKRRAGAGNLHGRRR
jgi:hypothetical protein